MRFVSDTKERLAQWQLLLDKHKKEELNTALGSAPMVEVADFLEKQPLSMLLELFLTFTQKQQSSLFCHFHENKQLELYNALSKPVFKGIFENMSSDLRADFYLCLDEGEQMHLLPYLSKKVRKDVLMLSAYPPEKAGGIMSTDFVAVDKNMTAEAALNQIRKDAPSGKLMYLLYMVDENMKLTGTIHLKDLIMAVPSTKMQEIARETMVFARSYDDKEAVARKIEKYDLVALPVLNKKGQIVGIVSYDDAIDVIREEDTEDMERFMGIIPDEEHRDSYLRVPYKKHFKQRIFWVASLFMFSVLSSLIIHNYEDVLRKWTFLMLYITTISDTGGNVGSQAATMIIRALSLGEISLKNWRKVLRKEVKIAFMVALSLFLLCFLKVTIFSYFFPEKESAIDPWKIGVTIALAIGLQVVVATIIGASFPLAIKALGKDPALAASPAITTIVDISGHIIYLGTACLCFKYLFA